jgi:tol-pal system protein YbgF
MNKHSRLRLLPAMLAVVFSMAIPMAQAAFFEDEEARIQINNLNEKIKTAQKALIELNGQNDSLKSENAKLRGEIETLERNLEETNNNLRSYYQEINTRLQKFEPQNLEIEGVKGTAQAGERNAYDSALKSFQDGNLAKADTEFSAFSRKYPSSPYWPLSQYWLANSKYANKDYTGAINAAQALIKRYPDHPRVPEAMLTIANCQLETNQKAAAKKTLESVVSRFGDSKSAKAAKEMLASIK